MSLTPTPRAPATSVRVAAVAALSHGTARTLLDFAATAPTHRLRRALVEADFRRLLRVDAVADALRRGHAGSTALRQALERHRPELALARSELKERFHALCEAGGIPMPELNAKVHGLMGDAVWREQRVIVELDGRAAHGTPAQLERDHGRDMRLRAAGFTVLRYTWRRVMHQPADLLADLSGALAAHGHAALT